jgi:SAM-dependent methyltransferase
MRKNFLSHPVHNDDIAFKFAPADVVRANQVFYGLEASTYDAKNHVRSKAIQRYYRSLLDNQVLSGISRAELSRWTALDIGCGTGFLEGFLVGSVNKIYAVDATADMLRLAGQKFPTSQVERIQAEATELPFLPATFDLVCSNAVLHHLYNWRSLLTQMVDLLKPGGRLFLGYEPNAIPYRLFRPILMLLAKAAPEHRRWGSKVDCGGAVPHTEMKDIDIHKLAEFQIFHGRGIDPFELRKLLLGMGMTDVNLQFTSLYQAALINDYGIPLPLDLFPEWVFRLSRRLSLSFSAISRKPA